MTPEPRHPPVVPSYGAAALSDLSSSMLASLDPDAPETHIAHGSGWFVSAVPGWDAHRSRTESVRA